LFTLLSQHVFNDRGKSQGLSHDSYPQERDLSLGPQDYEAGMLTTVLQRFDHEVRRDLSSFLD